LDGVGLPKHGTVDKTSPDGALHNYVNRNKEWVRSLVYCGVMLPVQQAQQALRALSNSSSSSSSSGGGASSEAVGSSSPPPPPPPPQQQHWIKMQDPKVVYSLSRLVVQPFDRCITHGKVEPTVVQDERKKRFHNLRSDVHDCAAVNKSAVASMLLLYGRSDTKNRRWSNVFDLASRIQASPGVRLPVKVIERIPHTFREQVQLFSSAAMLITVSGSALMNVPFMSFSSTLVELVRFSKGETSIVKTFGLDAAISSHVIVDVKSSQSDIHVSFNDLRQKLCDKNNARRQAFFGSGGGGNSGGSGGASSKKERAKYTDSAMAFADMNLFCANVTTSSAASSLKGFSAGIVAAIGA
jgi:uncharacterized membrane protein YgcG